MGYSKAELLKLLELIDSEVFEQAKTLEDAKARWQRIYNKVKDMILADLKVELGLL